MQDLIFYNRYTCLGTLPDDKLFFLDRIVDAIKVTNKILIIEDFPAVYTRDPVICLSIIL